MLRRALAFLPVVLTLAACGTDEAASAPVAPGLDPKIEAKVSSLLGKMTLEEKIDQMHGTSIIPVAGMYETPINDRLGIPSFKMIDGPRGVRVGKATTFPVGMARGATWDPDLEKKIGEAMGQELAAKGGNVLLAPTINILRHPAWGRAQETYGEDTFHVGTMGAAFIEGAQAHVIADAKHFAANSIEDTRFDVDVTLDERTLREIYLRQFKQAIDAGVGSVMDAYNLVDGQYCTENAHLNNEILRDDWGYKYFVVSDWTLATRSVAGAAMGGLDVEMPDGSHLGDPLLQAVQNGEVSTDVIDAAVRRILRTKFTFKLDQPEQVSADVVESKDHTDLTLTAEREAIVLLKNDTATLPLAKDGKSIAVVGELADTPNLGDKGSSNAVPSWSITPLAGLQDRAGTTSVQYVPGPTLAAADQATISGADAAVVVVGLTYVDEGENIGGLNGGGGDRHDLSLKLSQEQEDMIHAVAAQNPHTVVVVEGGSAIVMRPWLDEVPAVLMAWYPGQEGGHAIADVLFGDTNPSGKLPLTIPTDVSELPPFDNTSKAVTYDFLHGYRYVDDKGTDPEFPFGFGLSYTTFSYANLRLDSTTVASDGTVTASVDVTNAGSVAGDEVAELYVGYTGSSVPRAKHDLKAFERVHLDAGETRTVDLPIKAGDLAYWDDATSAWIVEPIAYSVDVGGSERDLPLSASFSVE